MCACSRRCSPGAASATCRSVTCGAMVARPADTRDRCGRPECGSAAPGPQAGAARAPTHLAEPVWVRLQEPLEPQQLLRNAFDLVELVAADEDPAVAVRALQPQDRLLHFVACPVARAHGQLGSGGHTHRDQPPGRARRPRARGDTPQALDGIHVDACGGAAQHSGPAHAGSAHAANDRPGRRRSRWAADQWERRPRRRFGRA